jgi:hypothetical protein
MKAVEDGGRLPSWSAWSSSNAACHGKTNTETLQGTLCIASPLCNGHKRSEIAPGLRSTQYMQYIIIYIYVCMYIYIYHSINYII